MTDAAWFYRYMYSKYAAFRKQTKCITWIWLQHHPFWLRAPRKTVIRSVFRNMEDELNNRIDEVRQLFPGA